MILLDRVRQHPKFGGETKHLMRDDPVSLRVHHDVMKLATDLYARDAEKLKASTGHMFMPAERCWIEWPMGDGGDMAVLFVGEGVKAGRAVFYAWRHDAKDPVFAPLFVDFNDGGWSLATDWAPNVSDPLRASVSIASIVPVFTAILALINSPKIVKRDAARLERLNRKRESAGRYTFHPHHVVRLNVDRSTVRVGASDGGDGASRALHFVRAHLRLWSGQYILVQPHWRGDAKVGIVKPAYEVDRQGSRWTQ